MPTIINNPMSGDDSGSGILIGVVLAIVIVALFIIYGLPAIRENKGSEPVGPDITNITVTPPIDVTPSAN